MTPVKVHSESDDNRADIAVLEAKHDAMCERIEALEAKMDELRKWQHTVLGASAVVLFVIGTWGTSIIKWLVGSDGK